MDLLVLDSLPKPLQNGATIQTIMAEQILFQQGDIASTFFVVESGQVRLVRYGSDDESAILEIAEPGQGLAEISLFSDTYPCTAIADVNSRVIAYPKLLLLQAFHDYPDLAESVMVMLVQKLERVMMRLELRDIRSAHKRLLRYLRFLAQPKGQNVIQLDRPLKDIATELGLAPETLSRALTRLEREGSISRQTRQIILHQSSAA